MSVKIISLTFNLKTFCNDQYTEAMISEIFNASNDVPIVASIW